MATKPIAAQADVRTRGSATTVTLTGAGKGTLKRVDVMCDELGSNPAVPDNISKAAKLLSQAAINLNKAIYVPAPAVAEGTREAS